MIVSLGEEEKSERNLCKLSRTGSFAVVVVKVDADTFGLPTIVTIQKKW
jgi:hypothetical protein